MDILGSIILKLFFGFCKNPAFGLSAFWSYFEPFIPGLVLTVNSFCFVYYSSDYFKR